MNVLPALMGATKSAPTLLAALSVHVILAMS